MTDSTDALNRLRAGLDRDEAIASAIDNKQCDSGWGIITTPGYPGYTIAPHIGHAHEAEAADHIVRHGPDRVLRQAEAFHEVMRLCADAATWSNPHPDTLSLAEDVITALADIYPIEAGDLS